ncbi:MAG: hypothetical protein R2701_11855 [Acidimicrobiales bacterium]
MLGSSRDQGWVEHQDLGPRSSVPTLLGHQLVRFASVGVVSTLLFAVLFAALVDPVGPLVAMLAALALSAVVNTARQPPADLRPPRPAGPPPHWTSAAVLSGVPLALNLAALGVATAAGLTSTIGLLGCSAPPTSSPPAPASPSCDGRWGAEHRWPVLRSRATHPLVRCRTVSVIASATSLAAPRRARRTRTTTAGWANVIATEVGTVPSFRAQPPLGVGPDGQRSSAPRSPRS